MAHRGCHCRLRHNAAHIGGGCCAGEWEAAEDGDGVTVCATGPQVNWAMSDRRPCLTDRGRPFAVHSHVAP